MEIEFKRFPEEVNVITTLKGDITRLDFDFIVNPASTSLMPSPGLCSQIFHQAGQGLIQECQSLKGCEIGQAKYTKAYNLACKGIIHVALPYFVDGSVQEQEILEACYWNSMALAYSLVVEQKWESITLAFPILGWEKGFDKKEACRIGVSTIQSLFRCYPDAKCIDVIFVCDDQENYTYMKEALNYAIYG